MISNRTARLVSPVALRLATCLATCLALPLTLAAGCDVNGLGPGFYTPDAAGGGVVGDGGGGTGLPCDIDQILETSCRSCHGSTPSGGATNAMVTLANLTATSYRDPKSNYAQRALARMQDSVTPMPPLPASPLSAADLAAFTAWVNAGTPTGSCGAGDGGVTRDPLNADPICTSGQSWTRGDNDNMRPGEACIACHASSREGPSYTFAGTVFPTGHEPDDCYAATGSGSVAGAQIVIIDAAKKTITLTISAGSRSGFLPSGNFHSTSSFTPPYTAKVVWNGKERVMTTPQTSGDCNGCHSQDGTSIDSSPNAPGRVTLPL